MSGNVSMLLQDWGSLGLYSQQCNELYLVYAVDGDFFPFRWLRKDG